MGVFIELTTDAFTNTFNNQVLGAGNLGRVNGSGARTARRPLRGLEVKDDTYALLKVVRADGSPIPLIDSGSSTGMSGQTTNFILQSVKEARMEKHQIVETFGEPYIFFFGQSPQFLDVQAILVNSNDFNWYAEWWANYDQYLRGTKLVEQGARTYLFYDDNIVEGYMLMAETTKTADNPLMASLSFRLFVTNVNNVNFVGDPNFPVRSSVSLPSSVDLTTADVATIGAAVLGSASQAALNDANAQAATQGAAQQAGGFGGAQSLSDALRGGLAATGNPSVDGILQNALDAFNLGDGVQIRSKPLRGRIADNNDEFTGGVPTPLPQLGDPYNDAESDQDGQPDATDLSLAAIQQANAYGADIGSPDLMVSMGLGVSFSTSVGFGVTGSTGATASFGVGASAGFGSGFYGGLNGGLGFTGSFTASASLAVGPPTPATAVALSSATVPYGSGTYGNGVPIQAGIIQGTGVGGGIPGGVSGGIGPDGPGTLTQFTGGTSYAQSSGFSSSSGYGGGLSANGASVSVGGAPSAFALVSAPGSLDTTGDATISFNIGPDGSASDTNTTGLFV